LRERESFNETHAGSAVFKLSVYNRRAAVGDSRSHVRQRTPPCRYSADLAAFRGCCGGTLSRACAKAAQVLVDLIKLRGRAQ
jgi:hypothetical protein